MIVFMQVKETEYEDTVFIAPSVNMETSVAKRTSYSLKIFTYQYLGSTSIVKIYLGTYLPLLITIKTKVMIGHEQKGVKCKVVSDFC